MIYAGMALLAVTAGFVQTVTGFGAGIVMMTVLPYLFGVIQAAGLSSSICLGLNATLAFQLREKIEWRKVILPGILYVSSSLLAIRFAGEMNLKAVTVAFGLFLITIAVYFLFFAKKAVIRPTKAAAVVCSVISGVCAGLFGIGGPLMALYYVQITDDHDTYLADLQIIFACNATISLFMRVARGYYTVDLIPYTLIGFALVMIGKVIGRRISDKINEISFKKVVYTVVGLSGVITLVEQLLK